MASEASLRRRQSLIWEVKDVSKYHKDSPVFSLMDSDWMLQVIPVYQMGKFSPSSYNIKLKICSGYQLLQPFEVVTFLEDRRNNVQMYCSKLTVSSTCETLFRASFDRTYEILPGVKIYDDMAIVCTFYPSTGLTLSTPTVSGSNLRIRHSLLWKTRKPILYQDRESPLFNLKDSKWKLEINLINTSQDSSSVYQICMRNSKEIQPFQPFEVEMFVVDKEKNVNIQFSRLNVSSYFEILYKDSVDNIHNKVPGLKDRDEIIIVCTFGPSIGVALSDITRHDLECQCARPWLCIACTCWCDSCTRRRKESQTAQCKQVSMDVEKKSDMSQEESEMETECKQEYMDVEKKSDLSQEESEMETCMQISSSDMSVGTSPEDKLPPVQLYSADRMLKEEKQPRNLISAFMMSSFRTTIREVVEKKMIEFQKIPFQSKIEIIAEELHELSLNNPSVVKLCKISISNK